MTKEELRTKYLNIRKTILDKEEQSTIITKQILSNKHYLNSKVIALYSSLSNEVNTNELIIKALQDNKKVCLPKVEGNIMNFYYIKSINDLQVGSFNIKEPTTNTKVNINGIDLMIIPGIYFDINNNRIGYGKGYYDKYLSQTNTIYKIGITFKETYNKEIIPNNANDISLDITLHS